MRLNHLRRIPYIPRLSTTTLRTPPVYHSAREIRLIHSSHSQLIYSAPQIPSPNTGARVIALNPPPPVRFSSSTPHNPAMTDKVEAAKRAAAQQAVEEHFDPRATYVGIGSGTTVVYVVEAIKERSTNPHVRFVPTGSQSRQVVLKAGLTPIDFDALPDDVMLAVAFDGADEVDEDLNCIKGGGACLFQEKLVAQRAKKFVCVADYRKKQPRLLTNWPSIPIEVCPMAVPTVLRDLQTLGSNSPKVRLQKDKSDPLKTDQDFFIIDAPFKTLLTDSDVAEGKGKGDGSDGSWEVNRLSKAIKSLTGVLEVGIFSGLDGREAEALKQHKGNAEVVYGGQKPIAIYFGMQDGGVEKRVAKSASQ